MFVLNVRVVSMGVRVNIGVSERERGSERGVVVVMRPSS